MLQTLQASYSSSSSIKFYQTSLKPTAVISMSKTLFILIAYLTCCVWAWPVAPEYRRSYNDFQPMEPSEPDLQQYNYNPWDFAQEPLDYQSDQPAADYYRETPLSEIEELSNLIEMYDSPPVWGQIVNQKPETELEELKAEERHREAEVRQRAQLQSQYENNYNFYPYNRQEKRDNVRQKPNHPNLSPSAHQHQTSAIPAGAVVTVAPVVPSTTLKTSAATMKASPMPIKVNQGPSGQKEVPLLRPPTKGKAMNIHEPDEPVINVAQRSSAVEKPSAYDTLRKYLTLEDALKKEAEKRRVHKRTPNSNANKQIVSDVDSLGGQLKNLKKSVI